MRNLLITFITFIGFTTPALADNFYIYCKGTDKTSLHNVEPKHDEVTGYIRKGKLKADPKGLQLTLQNVTQSEALLKVYSATDGTTPVGTAKLMQVRPGVFIEITPANVILWRIYPDPNVKGIFTLVSMKTYNLGGIASWTFTYVCMAKSYDKTT